MMFRKNLVCSVALLFAVSTLSAFQAKPADLTGTWTGTLTPDGGGNPSSAHLALAQKGETLTGTLGPDAERQVEIVNGKVTTVKDVTGATFQATQPNGAVMKFDVKLTEGRLKGTILMERPDGEKRTAAIDVGRAK